GIVLEIPDEMSGPCQLDGCSSYSDGRNFRARKVKRAPAPADVGIDDVRGLLRGEARKRNRLGAQSRATILLGVVHHWNDRCRRSDPDRNDEGRATQHHDETTDAAAPRQAPGRLR